MNPYDVVVPAGQLFPQPVLPPALANHDPVAVAHDRDGTLITAWIAVHGTSDSALAQLVPHESGHPYRIKRFNDATKLMIGRIHACLPQGVKLRYSTLCGITYETARRWSTIRFVTNDDTDDFGIDAFLATALEGLPTPIPPRMLTAQVKRDLVLGYQVINTGSKVAFLDRFGISYAQIQKWKAALADGDLDNNLVPRKIGSMTTDEVNEIIELRKQKAALEKENQRLKDHNESLTQAMRGQHVAKKDFDKLQKVVDALGKAIATMPDHGVDSDAAEKPSPQTK